jgi:polyhydroxybutyrate depolymerase
MDALADREGFVVAYPQAAIPKGDGFEWRLPDQPLADGSPAPAGAPDDVAFIADAIATIRRSHRIDARRIYVTGWSGGARMASELGCRLADVVAAIAPVAGLRFPAQCKATRPMPVIAFHGLADRVNPYAGGGRASWTYGVEEAARRWAAHDGCARLEGCALVRLRTIERAGHVWPGAPPLPPELAGFLGPETNAVDASTEMWRFFVAHHR